MFFFKKNKNKVIKDIVLRGIKNLLEFKKEKENYQKPVRVNYFWNNSYFKQKNNINQNRILLVEEHLNKITP